MVEMRNVSPLELIESVRIWTGYGDKMMPSRKDSELLKHFGKEKGEELLSQIKALEEDFYLSDAHRVAANLQDMAARCADDFRKRHPGIADDIVNAFVWCYTFDYK